MKDRAIVQRRIMLGNAARRILPISFSGGQPNEVFHRHRRFFFKQRASQRPCRGVKHSHGIPRRHHRLLYRTFRRRLYSRLGGSLGNGFRRSAGLSK